MEDFLPHQAVNCTQLPIHTSAVPMETTKTMIIIVVLNKLGINHSPCSGHVLGHAIGQLPRSTTLSRAYSENDATSKLGIGSHRRWSLPHPPPISGCLESCPFFLNPFEKFSQPLVPGCRVVSLGFSLGSSLGSSCRLWCQSL